MRTVTAIASKVCQALATVAVVGVVAFFLVRLIPGDPVLQILGTEATPESITALRAELNLDKSIPAQFAHYVGAVLRADLGTSIAQRGRPVTEVIQAAMPSTLSIVALGLLIGAGSGVFLGLRSGLTKRRWVDSSIQFYTILSIAFPTFLFSLLLILLVSLTWGLLPAGGWAGSWPANLSYVVLPGIAIGVDLAPRFIRTVRQQSIDVQSELFMEAAYVRGLGRRTLEYRHVLPNSLLPVITLIGMSIGGLLTNAVVVEAVFGMPGIGSELARAVSRRDYPVIQGMVLMTAVFVITANLLAEVVYTLADPRARVR
jgi:peptide/nickel transport system permease protein